MKFKINLMLLLSLLLTGCSEPVQESAELPDLDSMIQQQETGTVPETAPETIPETFSQNIFYLTEYQTEDPANLTQFRAALEEQGFVWHQGSLEELPEEDQILICNFPKEDLNPETYQLLNAFADRGGDMLFLLPASESETRYKYWNRFLESFCIQMDYDLVTENDPARIQPDDSILVNYIAMPERMAAYQEDMLTKGVFMRSPRSFYMLGDYSTDEMFVDVMLQTSATVTGQPCGGTEDDPLTYENQKLNVLCYSLDALRQNASVVTCGAADFLTDEHFADSTSYTAQCWIYSSLYWFADYQ